MTAVLVRSWSARATPEGAEAYRRHFEDVVQPRLRAVRCAPSRSWWIRGPDRTANPGGQWEVARGAAGDQSDGIHEVRARLRRRQSQGLE